MTLDQIRSYCLLKRGVTEDLPFGEETLAFRVMEKIFLLTGLGTESLSINLKCNPERALELRERYPEIEPGYHMNKKHWNTVRCNGSLPASLIRDLIDHSYDLVVAGLPGSIRAKLVDKP